jgi:hypothetical protein
MKQTFKNLILFIFFTSSAASAVGFRNGNDFSLVPLSGRLMLQCSEGSGGVSNSLLSCYTEILNPNEFEYFVGPANIAAEKVKLTCIRQDGSVEEKLLDYDSSSGQTVRKVNLWVNTLLQTGLLGEGANKIHYSLLKNGQPVQQGDFVATVRVGKTISCATIPIFDNSGLNLCNNPNSACERYFEQLNYCQ